MKKTSILTIAFLLGLITLQANAQYYEQKPKEEKPAFRDKLFFGGGLGVQFGTVTAIEVAPIVGYRVTKRFHAGVGGSYSYYKDNRYTQALEYYTYGGNVFSRFFLFDNIFAHAEVEALNAEVFTFSASTLQLIKRERRWIDSYLIGGGLYQPFGQRSGMYFMVLYNLNHQEDITPYSNPVIRIGFNF